MGSPRASCLTHAGRRPGLPVQQLIELPLLLDQNRSFAFLRVNERLFFLKQRRGRTWIKIIFKQKIE
jgi:hypothetical protein